MSAAFVYTPALAEGQLRPGHPLKPARARTCYELLRARGVFDSGVVKLVEPQPATREDVLRVHEAAYVDAVERLSEPDAPDDWEAAAFGLSRYGDTPAFEGMYEYYLLVAGAALEAARQVAAGEADVSFSPAGGVNHHAMPGRASGFGVFNDAAIAIAREVEQGRRVMYVDLDVHHGDGVEAAFENTDKVLTVSLHESTRFLFPGPKGGFAENTGTGAGAGYAVNVPLAPYTDDETWLWAFEELVPALCTAYRPDLLFVQLGVDGYFADPLAHFNLTERAYVTATRRLREISGGRLVAVGGGGYDVDAAPRIWALQLAALAGFELPDDLGLGAERPPALDASSQAQIRRFAEQTVATVKERVFPVHGLA